MKDLSLEEGNLAKKKPPLVASPFMGILSYYLLCKLIYDHSSCGVSICQIGLVLVFQMRPISCPSDKMSIEVGSSARCGKNWQSRQPRGCRELLLSRPTPKLTQHAPRPSAYQDLQHHTHKCLISKSIKPSWGFQSNIKDYIMPVLHPLPRQCSKFTPWTPHKKIHDPFLYIHFHRPPPPVTPMPVMSAGWKCTWKDRTPAFLGRPLLMEGPFTGGPRWVQWALLWKYLSPGCQRKIWENFKIVSKINSITMTTSRTEKGSLQ